MRIGGPSLEALALAGEAHILDLGYLAPWRTLGNASFDIRVVRR